MHTVAVRFDRDGNLRGDMMIFRPAGEETSPVECVDLALREFCTETRRAIYARIRGAMIEDVDEEEMD